MAFSNENPAASKSRKLSAGKRVAKGEGNAEVELVSVQARRRQMKGDSLGTKRVSVEADDVVGVHGANSVTEALVEGEKASGAGRLVGRLVKEVVASYPGVAIVALSNRLPDANGAVCSRARKGKLGVRCSEPTALRRVIRRTLELLELPEESIGHVVVRVPVLEASEGQLSSTGEGGERRGQAHKVLTARRRMKVEDGIDASVAVLRLV